MKNNRNYSYILIRNFLYINLDQRLMELFLILYFRTKPFSFFESKTALPILNYLPVFLIRIFRVLQFTYEFYKVKRDPELRNSFPKITTKYFGQCLLELRNGEVKVFNLKKQVVTTVFQYYISETKIKERISNFRQVTNLAPKLIDWNIEERF